MNNPDLNTLELHQIANLESIEERAETLKQEYLRKNIENNNPMVKKMINEYNNFCQQTSWRHHSTILDTCETANLTDNIYVSIEQEEELENSYDIAG